MEDEERGRGGDPKFPSLYTDVRIWKGKKRWYILDL